MKTHHKLQLYTAIVLSALMMSCGTQTKIVQQPSSSLSKELSEISPGILEGYLSKEDIPNSLALVPPPPEEGSAAFLLDQDVAATYVAMQDEARKNQATQDAVLAFPEAVNAFNSVLEVQISEANTPHLYIILRRTLADAGLSTYAAKTIISANGHLW